jgi:hypothetical protein
MSHSLGNAENSSTLSLLQGETLRMKKERFSNTRNQKLKRVRGELSEKLKEKGK